MSLATLKSKIQAIIDKATLGNIYSKIFKGELVDLVIPDGVTVCCENLYYAPNSTVSISGADVEEITDGFFDYCDELTTVDFPKLKIVNDNLFENFAKLKNVKLQSVELIGNYGFNRCFALTTVNAPLLITIGEYTFQSCNSLKELNLPSLTTIETQAFQFCTSLATVNAPSLTTIGESAFNYCTSLTTVNAPSLITIGVTCFNRCTSLTELNLPRVTTIDAMAIANTAIRKMTVGTLVRTSSTSFKQSTDSMLTELYVGKGTNADLYLQYNKLLTQECLHGIIENLADLTGKTAKMFYVGDENILKIDAEHITMLENKNWSYK